MKEEVKRPYKLGTSIQWNTMYGNIGTFPTGSGTIVAYIGKGYTWNKVIRILLKFFTHTEIVNMISNKLFYPHKLNRIERYIVQKDNSDPISYMIGSEKWINRFCTIPNVERQRYTMNEEVKDSIMQTDPMIKSWKAQIQHALEAAELYRTHMHPKLEPERLRKHLIASFLCLIMCILTFILPVHAAVDTTHAVLHHTASPDWDVKRIREIHVKERGWEDIGYHFLIRKDGSIETGRPLTKHGAHAKGRNGYVGIALTGYDTFSPEQLRGLETLKQRLGIRYVEPHHEECPGKGIPKTVYE